MSTITAKRLYTPEDLLRITDGDRFELVDGQLEKVNVSMLSSFVGCELSHRLKGHLGTTDLGWVFGSDNLYRCFPWKPNQVRKPDVSFIRRDRLTIEELPEGFTRIAPDLVIEVLSPRDLASKVNEKLDEYLRAGVRLIWIIDPVIRRAQVHRADGSARDLDEDGVLDGEDVVPGFRCRLGDLFPPATAGPA